MLHRISDMVTIRLIIPTKQDIDYIDSLWRDEKTMNPIGGPICLSKSELDEWFARMIFPGSKTNRYFIIVTEKGIKVGEASFYRYNKKKKVADLNIKIEYGYRGQGIAREAMTQLLSFYFGPFGGEVMQDAVAIDNTGGQRLLRSYGFRRTAVSEDAILYELNKTEFLQIKENKNVSVRM